VLDSAITDVLGPGVTFVTGGGYTRSDAPRGLWSLARKSVFIGDTQTLAGNSYAMNAGPVNPTSKRVCRNFPGQPNFCITADVQGSTTVDDGSVFQLANFQMAQRLFNVYDGPSLEDSNAFLDITPTNLVDANGNNDCTSAGDVKLCRNGHYMQSPVVGVPGIPNAAPTMPAARPTTCYLPNAAIAWKQPNGFYYPPAFHSDNLFFNNVPIRHYVIEARFLTPTDTSPYPYSTDFSTSLANYCNAETTMWNGFTDVDRQTELSDDDGSLTGLIQTISVNSNQFFSAPTQDLECKSDIPDSAGNERATAKTSPYDYVTAVVYADDCSTSPGPNLSCDDHTNVNNRGMWTKACTNEQCFGVPLHRELMIKGETLPPTLIHMGGQATGQRSTLIPNNMRYYIDTTVSEADQESAQDLNVFEPSKTYHVFLLFAKPPNSTMANQTVETFDVFVGKGLTGSTFLPTVHAEKAALPGSQYIFTSFDSDATTSPWLDANPTSGKWTRSYSSTTGMLTVTVDMSLSNFVTDYNNSIQGRCQPLSMCKWVSMPAAGASQCQCNTGSTLGGYLPLDCSANTSGICKWAIEDIDYPDNGAYGFSFTLPDNFAYGAQPVPSPSCLTLANNPVWNVTFQQPTGTIAGDCAYTMQDPPPPIFSTNPVPGADGCM
jgi:cell migration-inducing and hyaluronan-binding protein